ncbi:MAG: hypothetical protein VXW22_15015, partial [Pseudomonadota bacterium]|nr:hypothetical protein [Pseudomonadota bacterium]
MDESHAATNAFHDVLDLRWEIRVHRILGLKGEDQRLAFCGCGFEGVHPELLAQAHEVLCAEREHRRHGVDDEMALLRRFDESGSTSLFGES